MKLNYKRTFFVGFAFLSICAFWELYDGIIPKMLEGTFGLGETVVGAIMAIDNVLALFLLPLLGALSDKVNTRIGRRMPFIVGGTFAASVFIILLPIAEHLRNFTLFIIALGKILWINWNNSSECHSWGVCSHPPSNQMPSGRYFSQSSRICPNINSR